MAEQRHLAAEPAGELRRDEPMRKHTSWRTGGAADRAYIPTGLPDLARFLRSLPAGETVYPVGLGSNLLVRDGGVRGTVLFTHGALHEVRLEQAPEGVPLVYAQAGVASPKVARFAATHALRGAEFLTGIPGTVGGALAMNAGCYGSETWEIVASVLVVTRAGEMKRRTPAEYEIGYRHVALRDAAPAELFAAAWFRLAPGDGGEGRRVIKELLQRRIATQPLEQPNAGSVFRNPPGDYAARLIESCGLKGRSVGGAMVSPKHANFIVNTGTASAADIEALIELVQQTVLARCGVLLEREVRIIGEPK
ncbi:MAG TPA: UDP-N-acetylmuramate dehydrogenase [Burkholderiales bacterium]|nr:UDP-N-acetylmuramate dehydrogenase [Burkholderiales bacterium]